jgi:DNA-binding PadR family transcriptional regulator
MRRSAEGLRRQLLRRFIDVLIVAALKEREMTGYDIMLLLNSKHDLMISSGTIYSTLYSMEREGFVKGYSDGKRRVFQLTKQGMQRGELLKVTGRKVMVLLEGLQEQTA